MKKWALIISVFFSLAVYGAIEWGNLTVIGNLTTNGSNTFSGLTASTVPYLNASKVLTSSAVTPTELGYLSGLDSNIQDQIDGISTSAAVPITIQRFTSGSGTYYLNRTFIISSGSATAGATYTNNSVTFTVHETVSSATAVVMYGNGSPSSSGTLTKASGTGDATLTFSEVKTPIYLEVLMVGGGGGGGSGGAAGTAGTSPTAGGDTTFGSLTAGGGQQGNHGSPGGAGGTNTFSGLGYALNGEVGQGYQYFSNGGLDIGGGGGNGGGTPFGPGAGGGAVTTTTGTGGSAAANTGGGGGGGGAGSSGGSTMYSGSGGGGGGFIHALIKSPSVSYSYSVGAGGSPDTAGTAGAAGGSGGSGVVIVVEHYQ